MPRSGTSKAPTVPESQIPKSDVVYSAVAERRTQFDYLVWQVPVLSVTAQAFLFTISLGANTTQTARVIACIVSLGFTFMTIQLLTRHRQAEIADTTWLLEYEKQHGLQKAHGKIWRKRRNATNPDAGPFAPLAKLQGYLTWAIGLTLIGVLSLVTLIIAIWWPYLLQR